MNHPSRMLVRIAEIEVISDRVKKFTLVSASGRELPAFSPGSHIVVHLQDGSRIYRNAYSLVSSFLNQKYYKIAVQLAEASRGGSLFLHTKATVGMMVEVSHPMNLFPIIGTARKHVLVAGGIGITPFISYLPYLEFGGASFEIHYAIRRRSDGAFLADLERRCASRLKIYLSESNQRLSPYDLLNRQPLGTHLYVCGSPRFMDPLLETAEKLGWPKGSVHFERFGAERSGKPFVASLRLSQREVTVPQDRSLLEVLEEAGVNIPNSCRGGVCGLCETEVISGEVEHRDHFLGPEAKGCHSRIMPCVSRAKGQGLVLNL